MNTDNPSTTQPRQDGSQRRSILLLTVLAVLMVVIPFMFWHDTWFGRQLSDQEIEQYLRDEEHPRRIQHALSQMADRIIAGNEEIKKWYPRVTAMTEHPSPEIRSTAAWAMGQDNQSEEFHRALLRLLTDRQVMVRRNAALSLVRFGDASGRRELVSILNPHQVAAPAAGKVSVRLDVDQQIGTDTLLARITTGWQPVPRGGTAGAEVRAPFPGRVRRVLVSDGSTVEAGEPLVILESGPKQVLAALQGLYFVGEEADLPEVEKFTSRETGAPEDVRQQALLTAQAIRIRAKQKANR